MNEQVVRAELEKLVWAHRYLPDKSVVLAIWHHRTDKREIHLFEVYESSETPNKETKPLVLLHESKSGTWPFPIPLRHTMLFSGAQQLGQLISNRDPLVEDLQKEKEIIFVRPEGLPPAILAALQVRTQPDDFLRGWYVSASALAERPEEGSSYREPDYRPTVGLLQVSPLADLQSKVGVMHVESDGRWLPSTRDGVRSYTWYSDSVGGHPGAVLFEGGGLYRIEGFEVRTSAEYSRKVLAPNLGDEYVEAHLARIPVAVRQS